MTDTLEIKLKFNGKTITLKEVGGTALATYQRIMSIFSNPTDSPESVNLQEIH